MIDKREILETASALSLLPNIVEKDYVLGWLLAGIHAHPELVDSWVFKGGTCLKKCFFETYRFSEDLDFTLRDEGQIEEEFLKRVLGKVIAWVADESGLVLPQNQLSFDIYQNPRGRLSCQGKVGYRGPVSPAPSAGGMVDVEFAVQFLVLSQAAQHEALMANVGNIALLRLAQDAGLLPEGIGVAGPPAPSVNCAVCSTMHGSTKPRPWSFRASLRMSAQRRWRCGRRCLGGRAADAQRIRQVADNYAT